MDTTHKSHFNNAVAHFVRDEILSPLRAWFKNNHGIEVTIEDLEKVLEMPVSTPPKNNLPSGFGAAMTPPNTDRIKSSPKSRGRRKVATDPSRQCKYVFIKGRPDKRGKRCEKACKEGYDYCNQCIKKKSVIKELNSQAQEQDNATGNRLQPPNVAGTFVDLSQIPTQKPKPVTFKGRPHPSKPGHYIDVETNFIVRAGDNGGTYLAEAFLDEITNNERPLTEDEKRIATKRGFQVAVAPPPSGSSTTTPTSLPPPTSPPTGSLPPPQFKPSTGSLPPPPPFPLPPSFANGGTAPTNYASLPAQHTTH